MKKILLMSVLTCNFAIAGGQEGTGSIPEDGIVGTSSVNFGEQKVVCFEQKSTDENNDVYCIVIENNNNNN